MRVLLFSRSLNAGGAERQLVVLATSLHKRGIPVAVMVYYGDGVFRSELNNSGVTVIDLKKTGRWDLFGFFLRTIKSIRKYRPDVIYTFIGAHLVASTFWFLIGRPAIVWGVRASNMDLNQYDWLSRIGEYISIRMSRFADLIICNSEAGHKHIVNRGYYSSAITVIPNGIDTSRFYQDSCLRQSRRQSWNVSVDALVIGMLARIDPMKDHSNFLAAAKLVLNHYPDVHFVCIGSGSEPLKLALKQQTIKHGLSDSIHWVGFSGNTALDYSAIDLIVQSSSFGEGFPNTVGEAMACGLPVVATDVGDCRKIVDKHGWIVPPNDPELLAAGILKAILALPNWSHAQSRMHIVENYSVDIMVNRTFSALESVVRR